VNIEYRNVGDVVWWIFQRNPSLSSHDQIFLHRSIDASSLYVWMRAMWASQESLLRKGDRFNKRMGVTFYIPSSWRQVGSLCGYVEVETNRKSLPTKLL